MSRFIDKTPVRLEISNGDWIEIQRLSYEEFMKLGVAVKDEDAYSKIQFGIDLLMATIVNWSFKNDKGEDVLYAPGLIKDLDIATISELSIKIQEFVMPEKKSLK